MAVARGELTLSDSATDGTLFRKRISSQAFTLLGAIGLYFFIVFTYSATSSTPVTHQGGFLALADLSPRLQQIGRKLLEMYLYDEPLMPFATKVVLLLTPLLTVLLILLPWRRRCHEGGLSTTKVLLAFFLAILIGVPASLGLMFVTSTWWPVPRVTAQIAIFWAGLFALSYLGASLKMRKLIVWSSALVVFSFIGISNHIASDQLRVNMRDRERINRILARLETVSSLDSLQGLVVVGGSAYYGIPMRTTVGDMNVSAFHHLWSKVGAFSEIAGRSFKYYGLPQHVLDAAAVECAKSPKWPAEGSVSVVDQNAIVCLAD